MTKIEAQHMVDNHNSMIDTFMQDTLPKLLEMCGVEITTNKVTGEKECPMTAWFKANDLINSMRFYDIASKLQHEIRANGFDCKQNMQNNKLTIY